MTIIQEQYLLVMLGGSYTAEEIAGVVEDAIEGTVKRAGLHSQLERLVQCKMCRTQGSRKLRRYQITHKGAEFLRKQHAVREYIVNRNNLLGKE